MTIDHPMAVCDGVLQQVDAPRPAARPGPLFDADSSDRRPWEPEVPCATGADVEFGACVHLNSRRSSSG